MLLAVAALAAGSLATLSRWQRGAMLEVIRQDFVRTAHAKGLSGWRIAVVHVLRNALMPMMTLAGLHLPTLLAGAFVVEEVFGLPGVGFETLRAIEAHVKDSARGGWAFYGFQNGADKGKLFPKTADCYSCHQQNGATDSTFVQFYPTLIETSRNKGTYKETGH